VAADRTGADAPPADAIAAVRASVARPASRAAVVPEESLETLLGKVAASVGLTGTAGDPEHLGPFLRVYLDMLASFAEYLGCLDAVDRRRDDLHRSLFKLCGETVGHVLADFGIWAEGQGRRPPRLDDVAAVLRRGV
jgi:hypothetical protein